LLQVALTEADKRGTPVDELFSDAITRYVASTTGASPGSLRSSYGVPRNSPTIAVELPEKLYQGANQVARRLGKRREVLYGDALIAYLRLSSDTGNAFDRGHDLPEGAWRPKTSSE
jgi:hypothetical protein